MGPSKSQREIPVSEQVQKILSKKRRLRDQDKLFLLKYASNTNQTADIAGNTNTANGESLDQLFKNLIIILNHFFEYGFLKQKPQLDDSGSVQSASNAPIVHYWGLISRFFAYYSSVSYINSQMAGLSDQNKALSWLILALNEDGLLYYCFQLIFGNGTFLAHYNEDVSYVHLHREELLAISRNIYTHKLFVTSVQYVKYQEYVENALRERIKSNSELNQDGRSHLSSQDPQNLQFDENQSMNN